MLIKACSVRIMNNALPPNSENLNQEGFLIAPSQADDSPSDSIIPKTADVTAPKDSLWNRVTKQVGNMGEAIGSTVSQASQAIVDTTAEAGKAISDTAFQASQVAVETALGTAQSIGSTIGNTTSQASKTVAEVSGVVGSAATQASKVVAENAVGVSKVVGNTAAYTGKAVVETAAGAGKAVGETAARVGKITIEAAKDAGSTIGGTVAQAGEVAIATGSAVGDAVSQASQTVATTTVEVGRAVGSTATNTGKAVAEAGGAAVQKTARVLEQTTEFIGNNPLLRRVVEHVDLVKAEQAVQRLQEKYPAEKPGQIAHRLMLEKAIYVGGTGLASGILPGAAAALLAVDLAATAALQAELVYQIAAAYGLDLQDPTRKGEVITVFGLAFGGSQAIKIGVGMFRNLPLAGALVGASSNAAMLYTLGHAACQFYAAKSMPALPATSSTTLEEAISQASKRYLAAAIDQQSITDQILARLTIAIDPDKSWKELLPALQQLNLSETSLGTIAAHHPSPLPLEALLDRLDRDFALALLVRCQNVTDWEGAIAPEIAQLMETIAQKFNIDLNQIEFSDIEDLQE